MKRFTYKIAKLHLILPKKQINRVFFLFILTLGRRKPIPTDRKSPAQSHAAKNDALWAPRSRSGALSYTDSGYRTEKRRRVFSPKGRVRAECGGLKSSLSSGKLQKVHMAGQKMQNKARGVGQAGLRSCQSPLETLGSHEGL